MAVTDIRTTLPGDAAGCWRCPEAGRTYLAALRRHAATLRDLTMTGFSY